MATRNDVAKRAGVSVAAVSRAFNNTGYLSEEKRSAIMRAAEELEYTPNPIAVSLKNQRANQLLFFVPDIYNFYYMEMYRGMLSMAAEAGFMVLVSGPCTFAQIETLMIDGVIFPGELWGNFPESGRLKIPMVVAGYGAHLDRPIPHVNVDVAVALEKAVRYLRDAGHSRIAFASKNKIDTADTRYSRFRDLMAPSLGEDLDRCILGPSIEESLDEGTDFYLHGTMAADEYLEKRLHADAVLCFNDDTAIGLMGRLQSKGVRIPEDLSVVGIDGHSFGAHTYPALTSVSIRPREHGRECARLLIELITGQSRTVPQSIEPFLIERSSVRRR